MLARQHSLAPLALAALFGLTTGSAGAAAQGQTYHLSGEIAGPDYRWDYLSVDTAARRIYVGRQGGVTAIDLDTAKVTPTLVAGGIVHGVIPIGRADEAIAADGAADRLTLFNGATGEVIAQIPVGKGPDALVLEPVTGEVLAFNAQSQDASVVDVRSRKVVATIPLGGRPEFPAADGKGLVFDNITDKAEIAVIDARARKVVRRFPLRRCQEPTGLAYDAATGLLVSVCDNGLAKVVDAGTGEEVASLAVGKGADAVILDAERRLAFVPSGGDGTLSVISLRSRNAVRVVQVVKTKLGVRTGAVDPQTGTLYLPSADYLAPKSASQRPPVAPGSFKYLVVAP